MEMLHVAEEVRDNDDFGAAEPAPQDDAVECAAPQAAAENVVDEAADETPPQESETAAELVAELDAAAAAEAALAAEALRVESIERLARIVESVLFAAAAPVSVRRLVDILAEPGGAGPDGKEIRTALNLLAEEYAQGRRGIVLHEVAAGWQLRTARENADWVRRLFKEKPARLGRAALETLAIVAYRQPATKAEIEAVRGVDADAALNTLLAKRLVKIAGRKEAIGRPLLYATTQEFLEVFGLKDLRDMPALDDLAPAGWEEHGRQATDEEDPDTLVAADHDENSADADQSDESYQSEDTDESDESERSDQSEETEQHDHSEESDEDDDHAPARRSAPASAVAVAAGESRD